MPFARNPQFTGRNDILDRLHQCLADPERHPHVAVHGLGGSGKSAVAIELAYQIRDSDPHCAIYWVSAITVDRFQESYRQIAKCLQIPGIDDPERNMLVPVREKLSEQSQGKWLMIVDNVDDQSVLFTTLIENQRLYEYLPSNQFGLVLFTTRNRQIAVDLARNNTFSLGNMGSEEAADLVRIYLQEKKKVYSENALTEFLALLTYLPLAIIQALSFIRKNGCSIEEYIALFQKTRQSATELLEEDFHDPTRAFDSRNAVAATWRISFEQIRKEDRLAAEYLAFAACIAPQNIPQTIFSPATSTIQQTKAIGILIDYAFFSNRKKRDFYDMDILIHYVTQNWLKETNKWVKTAKRAVQRLAQLMSRLVPPAPP